MALPAPRTPETEPQAGPRALAEVAAIFLRLGCTAFGGPTAHIGYLRTELVERRRWIDDAQYADWVALCQFLPGPASSQLVFAIGMHRAGLRGALTAAACFTLPSALLMLAFAYGATHAVGLSHAGWLHGLRLAAVAVVAHAVWGMGARLCPDGERRLLCVAAATCLWALPGAATQLGVLALGAVLGGLRYRSPAVGRPEAPEPLERRARRWGAAALALWAGLLLMLPALTWATRSSAVAIADAFYRVGSLVFGGGHVVLPLLRAEVVPPGWMSDADFMAGYAAAQALPGPMFAFSAYLGALIGPESARWLGGLGCLAALFLPAWLLIGGALPFWRTLRAAPGAQAALAGANATVVGVLLAALVDPVIAESVRQPQDVVVALAALAGLQLREAPSWAVVAACALAGHLLG